MASEDWRLPLPSWATSSPLLVEPGSLNVRSPQDTIVPILHPRPMSTVFFNMDMSADWSDGRDHVLDPPRTYYSSSLKSFIAECPNRLWGRTIWTFCRATTGWRDQ